MVAREAGPGVGVVAIEAHSSAVLPVCQTVARKFHPPTFAFFVQLPFDRVEVFCPFVASFHHLRRLFQYICILKLIKSLNLVLISLTFQY